MIPPSAQRHRDSRAEGVGVAPRLHLHQRVVRIGSDRHGQGCYAHRASSPTPKIPVGPNEAPAQQPDPGSGGDEGAVDLDADCADFYTAFMPLYQCLVPAGSLDADRRAALAEAITAVHTSVTGAPRGFVNVVFLEYGPSTYFIAGQPHSTSVITGNVRAGRDRESRALLLTRLLEAWIAVTGDDPRDVLLGLNEVDPTSIMEAGLIMPAPGEEEAWLDRHRDQLGDILSAR